MSAQVDRTDRRSGTLAIYEEKVRGLSVCNETTCGTFLYHTVVDWSGHCPFETYTFVHTGEEVRVSKSLGFDPPEFVTIMLDEFTRFAKEQHARAYSHPRR